MATVIDALVVSLGLDAKGFLAGKNQATDATKKLSAEETKAAKEMEALNKNAAESFKKVRNEVLALLAIFTAGMGLKDFTESTIGSAVNLGYMAKNLQMSTQDLSAWQRAAERAGGSAEGITSALQDSQQQIAGFRLGKVTDQIQMFLRFGGKTGDLKDGNTYLLARAKIVQDLFKVDPARAKYVAQAMGISGDEFNFIKQGPQAILALVAAQEKNSAITEKQAEQALKLKNAWLDLRDRLEYVGTTVLLQLMPTFELWLQKLQKLADWVADHKADIAQWVDGAVASVQKFITTIDKAADSIGGWKNVLIALAAIKILSMTTSLLSLAGALTGVGGALGGLAAAGPVAGLAILAAAAGVAIKTIKDSTEPGHFVGRTAGSKHGNEIRPQDTNASLWNDIKKGAKEFFSMDKRKFVSRTSGAEQQRERAAFDYFRSQGWTSEQAAGITGSLVQESGVDPSNQNKQSGAYGAGQWLGSRVADFRKWSGHDLEGSSLEEQLAFMQYELTKGNEQAAGRRLRGAKTAAEAAAIHAQYYERPGTAEANIGKRQAYANSIYASLGQANASQIASQSVDARSAGQSAASISHMTSSAETNINGPITIHTQATDAQGIAKEFGKAVAKYSFTVPQANTGLT
ncbi:phage tail tip lysozyme [Paraburkholderia elongata]|uniref:Phage tail lysozyme domain-containing protein n=1 Tax=Paraburkholderia elongata TaxID=2675747 RepID=A0A972NV08_9BURK|nr:phage tail tip lysozyme [Paraburkholderia elongata]NPT59109.1 hypothetical protein [Paraburkholderia elongata]